MSPFAPTPDRQFAGRGCGRPQGFSPLSRAHADEPYRSEGLERNATHARLARGHGLAGPRNRRRAVTTGSLDRASARAERTEAFEMEANGGRVSTAGAAWSRASAPARGRGGGAPARTREEQEAAEAARQARLREEATSSAPRAGGGGRGRVREEAEREAPHREQREAERQARTAGGRARGRTASRRTAQGRPRGPLPPGLDQPRPRRRHSPSRGVGTSTRLDRRPLLRRGEHEGGLPRKALAGAPASTSAISAWAETPRFLAIPCARRKRPLSDTLVRWPVIAPERPHHARTHLPSALAPMRLLPPVGEALRASLASRFRSLARPNFARFSAVRASCRPASPCGGGGASMMSATAQNPVSRTQRPDECIGACRTTRCARPGYGDLAAKRSHRQMWSLVASTGSGRTRSRERDGPSHGVGRR